MFYSKVTTFFTCLIFFLFFSHSVQAQNGLGIGIQAGSPSGITAKLYGRGDMALDFLAAWDSLRDMYFVNVHGIFEQPIGRGPTNFFYGPGAFVGGERQRDTFRNGDIFVAGVSGSAGINIFFGNVEVYGQATPRLSLIGQTSLAMGGGIGVRFYFN
jgi:hypothetical protein